MAGDTKNNFNNERYGDHKALTSPDNFYKDKVYLYKIYQYIRGLNINNKPETKILEVGCSDGSFINFLKKDGFSVYGMDISKKAVEKASCLNLNVIQGDAEQGIKFPDNFFNIVIASEVIEHLYDTDYFLQELYRVTKDRGYLFLSTPNLVSIKNRLRILFGLYPNYSEYRVGPGMAGHIRSYTPRTLKKQLTLNGWQVLQITSPNFLCPMTKNVPVLIKKIAIKLGDIFFNIGSHIIIKAEKNNE